MTEADNATVAALVRSNLEEYGLNLPGTAYYDASLDCLSTYYNAPGTNRLYLVLEENGTVIGGVGFAEFPPIPNCAELQKLYLSAAEKGKGYGEMLFRRICDEAHAHGYETLYLETHSCLQPAVGLYRKCGFREIPRPDFVEHSTMDLFFIQ